MREQQGHDGLYKMGFDGAAIEKLRHLNEKQYEELLIILNEFHSSSSSSSSKKTTTVAGVK